MLKHFYMSKRSSVSSSYNINKSSVIETESTTTRDEDLEMQRKITLATEGFTTIKFCELVLRDRNRLSKENALTISEYIIAMKREINPRLYHKEYNSISA